MRLLLAVMLLAAPMAAQAEVTDRSAAGFQIRHVLNIDAPQAQARAAVQEIGRWWSDDHTYSGKASNLSIDAAGCFCEKIPGGFVRHMTVVYSDPGALKMFGGLGPLQTTGAAGHLSFETVKAQDPAKSVLTLTYNVGGYAKGGLAETWAAPVDMVLGAQAGRLKKYIETGKPD